MKNNTKEKWEEEFEDIIEEECEYGLMYMGGNYGCKLKELVEKYIGKIWLDDDMGNNIRTSLEVKIKARKGKIVIERVKE